jgi:hypothetical protein
MRLRAGLTSSKLALFPRSGTTSRTVDSEYLFCGECFFHIKDDAQNPPSGMVDFEWLSIAYLAKVLSEFARCTAPRPSHTPKMTNRAGRRERDVCGGISSILTSMSCQGCCLGL